MTKKETDPYEQPQEISEAQQVFPANLGKLLPSKEIIPAEFWRGHTEWNKFVSSWFFGGYPDRGLMRRDGVDAEKAYTHLSTILRSFEPKHEHKEAAVAWLASRWFLEVGPEVEEKE